MPTGFRMKKSLSSDRKLSGNGRARGRESDSRNNDSDGEIYRRVRKRGEKGSFDSKKRKMVDGGSGMRVPCRRPQYKDGRKPNFEEDGARRHGGQDSYRSGGRDSLVRKDNNGNGGMHVTKLSYGSQRRFDEDSGVEKHGGRDSYKSEGRDSTLNAPDDRKKTGKPPKWKLGKLDKEDFEVERGNGEPRGKKDGISRNKGWDSSVQVRSGKPGLKGRIRDDVVSDKREGDADSEKDVKGKERKKKDGRNKSSGDVRAETDPPPRKRKRIKTDRYDLSNKKLEDSVSSDEKTEKDTEEEIKVSLNAQFRAIAPHPSILSFVEDNLLGRRRLNELQKAGYNIKISAPLDNNPFSTNPERDRIEENVFRNKLEFFTAAKISTSFPPPLIPEIAFAGRSNVGKSSLLNALTRQWGVVRTSDKPGLTQSINFFRLSSKICLVDLPGYGFAYAKEEVKDSWEELVKEYVSTRVGLQRVCLLIDTKWGMKPRDKELIELMERHETPYQIVLTKTDIVFPIDVARRAMQIHESLKANKSIVKPVMMVSSESGAGIRTMRSVLSKLTRFIKP